MRNRLPRPIASAYVVEPDEASRRILVSQLRDMGLSMLRSGADAQEAWIALTSSPVELLVCEWKLPGISALALVNRLRCDPTHRHTPVLFATRSLQKGDLRLLQELGAIETIDKPATPTNLARTVDILAKEAAWRRRQEELIDRAAVLGDTGDEELVHTIKRAIAESTHALPLALAFSRRLVDIGRNTVAESLLRQVLGRDRSNVIATHLLGKVLLRTRRYDEARVMLLAADAVNTGNMARLMLLGENELQRLDPVAAGQWFKKAITLDPGDAKAMAGADLSATMTKAQAKVQATMQEMPRNFASLANAMGVAMVRADDIERGVEHYRQALMFVHDSMDGARLRYNVGLAFWRWNRLRDAQAWFREACVSSAYSYPKAQSCLDRVTALLGGGELLRPTPLVAPPTPGPNIPTEVEMLDELLEEESIGASNGAMSIPDLDDFGTDLELDVAGLVDDLSSVTKKPA